MGTYLAVERPEFLIRPYSPNLGFPLDDECPVGYASFRELSVQKPYGVVLIHDTSGNALFCDANIAYTHFSTKFTNPRSKKSVTQLFFYVLRSNDKGLVHLATSRSPQDSFIQNYLQFSSGDATNATLAGRKMVAVELLSRKKYEEALHFLQDTSQQFPNDKATTTYLEAFKKSGNSLDAWAKSLFWDTQKKIVLEIAKKSARIAYPYLFAGALSFFVPTHAMDMIVRIHQYLAVLQLIVSPHEYITSTPAKVYNNLSTVAASCHLLRNFSNASHLLTNFSVNHVSLFAEGTLYFLVKMRELYESLNSKAIFEAFEAFESERHSGSLYNGPNGEELPQDGVNPA